METKKKKIALKKDWNERKEMKKPAKRRRESARRRKRVTGTQETGRKSRPEQGLKPQTRLSARLQLKRRCGSVDPRIPKKDRKYENERKREKIKEKNREKERT